jgi:signal transduction histidine kinase
METLLTVLITLMVVALAGAGINLVRLNRKADELDTLKLDMIDINDSINRMIENLEREQNNRIEKWVASTDRRFDYMRNDLDKIINKKK